MIVFKRGFTPFLPSLCVSILIHCKLGTIAFASLLCLPLTELFPGSRNPGSDLLELRLRCNNGKKIGSDCSASPMKPIWSWEHHPFREFSSLFYLHECNANYSSLRRSFLILLCVRLVKDLFPAPWYSSIWDISSCYSNPANQLYKSEC